MLERVRYWPVFLGERYWPGRYVITTGFWFWTGRVDRDKGPEMTTDIDRALVFVSARHAYENARPIRALQSFKVRRMPAEQSEERAIA